MPRPYKWPLPKIIKDPPMTSKEFKAKPKSRVFGRERYRIQTMYSLNTGSKEITRWLRLDQEHNTKIIGRKTVATYTRISDKRTTIVTVWISIKKHKELRMKMSAKDRDAHSNFLRYG